MDKCDKWYEVSKCTWKLVSKKVFWYKTPRKAFSNFFLIFFQYLEYQAKVEAKREKKTTTSRPTTTRRHHHEHHEHKGKKPHHQETSTSAAEISQ